MVWLKECPLTLLILCREKCDVTFRREIFENPYNFSQKLVVNQKKKYKNYLRSKVKSCLLSILSIFLTIKRTLEPMTGLTVLFSTDSELCIYHVFTYIMREKFSGNTIQMCVFGFIWEVLTNTLAY